MPFHDHEYLLSVVTEECIHTLPMCYCDDTKLPPAVQMTVLCSYLELKRTLLFICSLELKMVWFTSTGRSKRAKPSIQTADFTSPVKVPHYSVNNVNCFMVCTCVYACVQSFFSYLMPKQEAWTPTLRLEAPISCEYPE